MGAAQAANVQVKVLVITFKMLLGLGPGYFEESPFSYYIYLAHQDGKVGYIMSPID